MATHLSGIIGGNQSANNAGRLAEWSTAQRNPNLPKHFRAQTVRPRPEKLAA
jgi:hypothetical protein